MHWSASTYVPVALDVGHVWAPETIYDPAAKQFMVFWSSPIDKTPNVYDPHDIYYVLTKDLVTYGQPAILYSQPGRDLIDATIGLTTAPVLDPAAHRETAI